MLLLGIYVIILCKFIMFNFSGYFIDPNNGARFIFLSAELRYYFKHKS